ncbi:hypothetical protein CRI94_11845 [Longibacter salinarum]|uniref:DUF3098 domain-containing protein n=1 Tax=Longibacter salinarum TaxID=1850348 RepID=A0A2A8CVU6_9BACT|nr:hypothetical protein [Longibacter salinarum]PEN12714.1 hypothetical protein CRI94_11845 [Longibacter salinarum]
MSDNSFSLQIGPLVLKSDAIRYIVAGVFLLGVIVGLMSIIHVDSPDASSVITMPLFWASAIPIVIIFRGIRKADVVS